MNTNVILAGILFVSLLQNANAGDSIILAAIEYPPYSSIQMKNGGMLTQIVEEAYERVGYKVVMQYYPWSRATQMVKEGRLDGLADVWMREKRKEWLLYSEPMPLASEVVLYKRKELKLDFDGQDYLMLKPYLIGSGRGYADPIGLEKVRSELQISKVTEDIQNLKMLKAGHIDLVIIDKFVAQYILNKEMPGSVNNFDWVKRPLSFELNYVGISKKTPNALKKLRDFNRGLASMIREKRFDAILEEHGFKQ